MLSIFDRKKYREEHKAELAEKQLRWRESNKTKINAYGKKYREEHIESVTACSNKWHEENKERQRKYRELNKAKIADYVKKWSETDNGKESGKRKSHKRRANERNLPSTLTNEQWESIKEYFSNLCAYCGKQLPLEQEHFLALNNGGEYTTNNIIPSCRSCNRSKGAKHFAIWYPIHRYYSKKREKSILDYLNYKNGIQQLSFA